MNNFNYLPTNCPSCGYPLEWKGVDVVCTNEPFQCPDRGLQIIEYFLITLGCENITATTLRKLGVKTISDIYKLDEFDISCLDGFGTKRAEQIIFEINKTLKTTPDKLLASFGISGIGVNTAREILKMYNFDEVWELSENELRAVDGVGEKLAENFTSEIGQYKVLYDEMVSLGLKWATATNNLRGNIFTLTGNGPIKRDVLEKMIESNGGVVKGISKKTNYLVTDDPNSNSGKSKKAREYGVSIISYEKLLEMLEN